MPTVKDVKNYWNANPLLSYELDEVGSPAYFDKLDSIKRQDSDVFAMHYWGFERYAGKRLLDVGCGPGWLAVNYALGGAEVHAIDLTERAVAVTKAHLSYRKTTGVVIEGNAEAIPYDNDVFDVVVSSGVLHHTESES